MKREIFPGQISFPLCVADMREEIHFPLILLLMSFTYGLRNEKIQVESQSW